MFGATPSEKAYTAPFFLFLGFLALGELVAGLFDGRAFWMVAEPRYWIYPVQTVVCGAVLIQGWRHYEMQWPTMVGIAWAFAVGALVFGLWIAPQALFGVPGRMEGFDPAFFGAEGPAHAANLAFRFLRLVVVVPLLEEIFWRGFLLRWVIHHDWQSVPFGTWTWRSFAVVTVGFCLEHQPADWAAAVLAGALYNLVAFRTRSLAACVLAHALTNLLLGLYVLRTAQWGFW